MFSPSALAVLRLMTNSNFVGVRFGSKADMCSALGDVRLVPKADIHRRHIIDIVLSKSSRITAREPDALSLIFFVPTLAFKFVVFPESVLVCWDSVGRLWRLHAMSCFIR